MLNNYRTRTPTPTPNPPTREKKRWNCTHVYHFTLPTLLWSLNWYSVTQDETESMGKFNHVLLSDIALTFVQGTMQTLHTVWNQVQVDWWNPIWKRSSLVHWWSSVCWIYNLVPTNSNWWRCRPKSLLYLVNRIKIITPHYLAVTHGHAYKPRMSVSGTCRTRTLVRQVNDTCTARVNDFDSMNTVNPVLDMVWTHGLV